LNQANGIIGFGLNYHLPIMINDSVRCCVPWADLAAPSAVPATVQQIPINAMTKMNQRVEMAWELVIPQQQDLGSSSE